MARCGTSASRSITWPSRAATSRCATATCWSPSHDESSDTDWECLAASNDEVQLTEGTYALVLQSGPRSFDGDAILVRSDGLAHVFRGIGPLTGVADAELA